MGANNGGWKGLVERILIEVDRAIAMVKTCDDKLSATTQTQALINQRLETLERSYAECQKQLQLNQQLQKETKFEVWKIILAIGSVLIGIGMLILAIIKLIAKLP